LNMRRMSVTLGVSKLSGWLKASAYCSEGSIRQRETRDMEMWHTEERANQQRMRRVCGPASVGRMRRRKRTLNMRRMDVTLEVSKLSGWLKASAYCSEGSIRQRETRDMEMWHTEERANQQRTHVACVWGQKVECRPEAYLEHVPHVCDAGGVKAQRPVESIRILPSPKGVSDRGKRVAQRCSMAQSSGL